MASSKLTALTSGIAALEDSYYYVDDPTGTPVSKQGDIAALAALSGTGAVSTVASAADTEVVVYGLPEGLVANMFWVVVDAYTDECEIRKVTSITTTTLGFSGGFAYDHAVNDVVLFVDQPIVNVKWFGATGDGSTDDTTALQRAFIQAATPPEARIYVPLGTYMISSTLRVPDRCFLFGDGEGTEIKAAAGASFKRTDDDTKEDGMIHVGPETDTTGHRYHGVRDVFINGNSGVANIGLYVFKVVHSYFRNVIIDGCTGSYGAGLLVAAGQNSIYEKIKADDCDIPLLLVNGAKNNEFIAGSFTGWADDTKDAYCAHLADTDANTMNTGDISDSNDNNCFTKCLFEHHDADNAVRITNGVNNTFNACLLGQSDVAGKGPVVYLAVDAVNNHFYGCAMSAQANSSETIIDNRGPGNYFHEIRFSNVTAADEIIHTYNLTHIVRCYLRDGVIVNKSGNVADNVIFVPAVSAGVTGNRPTPGDAIFGYFDTTLGKPMWYNGSAWIAAILEQTEITDELTTITHTAPGTPDYALQDLVDSGGGSAFGFKTKDEGNTVMSVIVNLQARVNELETKLVSAGILADAD